MTDETAMRADLITNYYYQDSSVCDLLLKYNGYSNPFAIDINDIILIPEVSNLSSFGQDNPLLEIGRPRKKKATNVFQPTTKQDKRRLNFLIKKAGAGAAPIPPNIACHSMITFSIHPILRGCRVQ